MKPARLTVLAALAGAIALIAGILVARAEPLTPKQFRAYKELRKLGITKKESARVARDPGVKKGEWGWTCEVDPVVVMKRVKGAGVKYRKNAVCE